jgi:hypothetical protein
MNMFKPTKAKSIDEYLSLIEGSRKSEILILDNLIKKTVPNLESYFAYNMLGYGRFRYKGKSGREGEWPIIALASQKNYISLYVCSVLNGKYIAEYYKSDLPRASIGKSCIRFKKLSDVDLKILEKIINEASKNPMSLGA